MELVCPHCRQALQFSGKRPAFCGYCGKSLPSSAEDPTVAADTATADAGVGQGDDPSEIGGYRLLRVLGEGGMGRVYEAEQIASGRRVALKLISARHVESPAAVERFRREGRLASVVSHPRCVFILAADEAGGRPYIVMELMPGTTLQDLVERSGPLPVARAVARILDVSAGLREIHRLGIVHRDVKPSNCLLDSQGNAKIGDFGLSRSLIRCDALTRTGTFIGTPLYASPEQIKGDTVGPRSDVYSVAATLYYLLTGRAPFHGGDSAATLARIVSDPAPPMRSRRPELPAALDKAVLRGLERDPAKRWRNLDEFEAALVPFLPGRLSIGSLGFRFGAFLIDYFVMSLVSFPIALYTMSETAGSPLEARLNPERQLLQMLIGLTLWGLYFGGCEALWGCTPGKRWLGLRVCKATLGERATVLAVLLRTGVLFFLLNLGTLVLQATMFAGAIDPSDPDPVNQMRTGLVFAVAFYPALAMGIGTLLCTMRARNGYRGLHEFLSGTRVMRLPETAPRRTLRGQDPELATLPPDGLPARIGPFEVTGILSEVGRGHLLAAQDASLGRRVWIWWRPADEPPLPAARHDLGRATRLRWLAGGLDGHSQWDAFLGPDGGVLAASPDRISWGDARLLLGQLADELIAAEGDGTLPETLSVGQVWIRPDGQAVLLDIAVGPAEFRTPVPPLSLLARVAMLALGATPRVAHGRPIAVGVPLPRYASAIVGRLVGIGEPFKEVQEVQTALAAAADKPAQTTRPRRLAHLALLAAFFSVAFCSAGVTAAMPAILVAITGFKIEQIEAIRTRLAEVAELDKAAMQDPDPARRQAALVNVAKNAELARALAEATERTRRHRQARLDSMGWATRKYAEAVEKQVAEQREKQKIDPMMLVPPASNPEFVRSVARSNAFDRSEAVVFPMAVAQTVMVALWPLIWVVWAFLTRGGLSFLILGLALVRRDGRPALRAQCAWRALLVWAPVTGLAVASAWLDAAFWTAWPGDGVSAWLLTVSLVTWWASVLLLPLYAALALIYPQRSLHDWLAGTYLVPR